MAPADSGRPQMGKEKSLNVKGPLLPYPHGLVDW